jgi:hypothetical protein
MRAWVVGCVAASMVLWGDAASAASGGAAAARPAKPAAKSMGSPRPAPQEKSTAPVVGGIPKAKVIRSDQDAGLVQAGTVLKFEFPIRNVGSGPLQIFGAKADCGCAVPSFVKLIPPGETRPVRVTMNTHGMYGRIEKHVYVECDDLDQASLLLTVKATLPEIVQVLPSPRVLVPIVRGRESRTRVTLHPADGETVAIREVGCDRGFVRVTPVAPATEGGDPGLEIVVAPEAPADGFEATVRVSTSHSRKPWIAFTLFGQPQGTVMVQPPRVDFGHLRPDSATPVTRLLSLSRRQGAFKVLRVETGDPALHVTVQPDATPRYCELEVAYVGGWTGQQVAGTIVIHTDDPGRPRIEVPYSAEVW